MWYPELFPPSLAKSAEAVHALYTHTLFYFAQVYGNLGDTGILCLPQAFFYGGLNGLKYCRTNSSKLRQSVPN